MLEAFHSNWTKPFFAYGRSDKEYFIDDFEVLTTMLSALQWRKNNGGIKMYTDLRGKLYYDELGISHIWNLGIETILDEIDEQIDSFLFWAAGKIYSLKNADTPCVMLDTDFIVWNKLKMDKDGIYVIHTEDINLSVYPDKAYFNMNKNYHFDEEWSWTEKPCNTAFLYIKDNKFKNYYTDKSIEFMKNCLSGKDTIANMVFAEQRLLSMCAKQKNISVNSLMELTPYGILQNNFTHVWGYKRELRKDEFKRKKFCTDCIKRIIHDFPEEESTIFNMKIMQKYYKEIGKTDK